MSVWSHVATPKQGDAWVTGASKGIGRALTLALVDDGWRVHVTARSAEDLEAFAKEREGRIIPRPGDVTDAARMREIVEEIEADRPVALAVLNAGVYLPMRAQEYDADKVAKTFRINVEGAANGLDPLLKRMIARRSGHVALTASVAGFRGLPRATAYSGTKAALIAMAEALAFDLVDVGVRISVINPGFVKTEATAVNDFEMPFLMTPEDAARRIVKGLKRPGFEIAFPTRFALILRTIGLLPNRAYFAVMRKAMGWDEKVD